MIAFVRNLRISRKLALLIGLGLLALVFSTAQVLAALRREMLEDRQVKTRHLVEVAYGVIADYGDQVSAGKLTEDDAKAGALRALGKLRYAGTEYFWVNDMRP